MIESFLHKGLAELFETGEARRIDGRLHDRILVRLDTVDAADTRTDLNVPGYDFHKLKGQEPTRYSIHVNGPWCITFGADAGHARRIDFEQHH